MDRRRLLALSGALAVGSLAGCVSSLSTDEPDSTARAAPGTDPDIDDDQLRELVAETNGFAFDLYRELLADDSDENLFASPVSVSVALAMAYAGARGETREGMREAMRYTLADDELHEAFNALQREFDERGEDAEVEPGGAYDEEDDPAPFELSLANSVWGQEGYPFEAAYLEILEGHYAGGLREVDYAADPDGTREEINAWVAEETEDRIDELLPETSIDELTRLVLVNAVYFLANWKHPFSEGSTENAPFTALDGTDHEVPLMRESRSWEYAEVDGAQAVDLPYVGEETSMLVVLPPEGEFESYERSFDGETLAEITDKLESQRGTVRLPRFEFESGFELSGALERLGMGTAFGMDADFTGITEDQALAIDEVYHDAFVAVDEAGTEAAAATAVVMYMVSASPPDEFELVADRPFLFVIRDRPTDTVLFLGRVIDPEGWA